MPRRRLPAELHHQRRSQYPELSEARRTRPIVPASAIVRDPFTPRGPVAGRRAHRICRGPADSGRVKEVHGALLVKRGPMTPRAWKAPRTGAQAVWKCRSIHQFPRILPARASRSGDAIDLRSLFSVRSNEMGREGQQRKGVKKKLSSELDAAP